MKLLFAMNLSPEWATVLKEGGFEALHWSAVGDPSAPDEDILAWASANGYVVFTHDLDFGAILAATKTKSPSVLQIRTEDVSPYLFGHLAVSVLVQFDEIFREGALISVDLEKSRVRVLPIG
jgi:predicted nuclease of predicted toxin-antitoxin system